MQEEGEAYVQKRNNLESKHTNRSTCIDVCRQCMCTAAVFPDRGQLCCALTVIKSIIINDSHHHNEYEIA